MTVKQLVSRFKKIKKLDLSKIAFEQHTKSELDVCFVIDGSIKRLRIFYVGEYQFDWWKPQFEEFVKTGKFDFSTYHEIYGNGTHPSDVGVAIRVPMILENGVYVEDSKKTLELVGEYRRTINYEVGIRRIAKK